MMSKSPCEPSLSIYRAKTRLLMKWSSESPDFVLILSQKKFHFCWFLLEIIIWSSKRDFSQILFRSTYGPSLSIKTQKRKMISSADWSQNMDFSKMLFRSPCDLSLSIKTQKSIINAVE